jgi:predicted transcriptional regulator
MSDNQDLVQLTADIVAAYVAGNTVASAEIPALVAGVHASLKNLGNPVAAAPEPLKLLVSIKKSITPDYLISLEDGKSYKSLKRHLAGKGLTPAEYREKWGLPRDYPMVAPSYSEQRSQLARASGLGQARKLAAAAKAVPAKKGRARKAA